MKTMGVLLIALGVLGLAYGGISWTTREKVVDLGPVEVSHNSPKSLPLPPLVGGFCLVAGAAMVLGASRRGV
jgi:uncharacterized membrane protein YidH (DUF202 family)